MLGREPGRKCLLYSICQFDAFGLNHLKRKGKEEVGRRVFRNSGIQDGFSKILLKADLKVHVIVSRLKWELISNLVGKDEFPINMDN